MFIQAITNKLLQELNGNSQSITFRGGSLLQVANDRFEFKTVQNYYTVETTEFIPVMLDFVSSPKNIPNKEVYDWTVDITFGLTGENETELQDQRLAINEFRASLVNTPLSTITIGSVVYNYVTSATDISLVRDVVIVNGKKRVLVSMQVFLQSGIDTIFGNNRIVELRLNAAMQTYVAIFPFEFNILMVRDTDSEMELSKTNVESVARNRTLSFTLKLFHENTTLFQEIIKDIIGTVALNRTYKLRFKIPENATAFNEYTVLLVDGSLSTAFGTQNLLDITFKVAYE